MLSKRCAAKSFLDRKKYLGVAVTACGVDSADGAPVLLADAAQPEVTNSFRTRSTRSQS